MKKFKAVGCILLCFILCFGMLAGCGSSDEPEAEGGAKDEVVIATDTDLKSLDPMKDWGSACYYIYWTCYNRLVSYNEETGEFEAELKAQSPAAKEELGDLLFSVVNAARLAGLDPEDALNRATEKFIGRFERVEQAVLHMGKRMEDLSLAELDAIWERVKHAPAGENPGEMPVNP